MAQEFSSDIIHRHTHTHTPARRHSCCAWAPPASSRCKAPEELGWRTTPRVSYSLVDICCSLSRTSVCLLATASATIPVHVGLFICYRQLVPSQQFAVRGICCAEKLRTNNRGVHMTMDTSRDFTVGLLFFCECVSVCIQQQSPNDFSETPTNRPNSRARLEWAEGGRNGVYCLPVCVYVYVHACVDLYNKAACGTKSRTRNSRCMCTSAP